MRVVKTVAALAAVAASAVGCGVAVSGTAVPAPNLKPRPLFGATVQRVLLDNVDLSRLFAQTFVTREGADVGGPDKLYDVLRSQDGCLGVTAMLQKSVYQSGDVRDLAAEEWWNNGDPAQVVGVMEGVVTLPSAAQAQQMFAQFSQQWQRCNGMTTSEQSGPVNTTNAISDVRLADPSVIAATKLASSVIPNLPPLRPSPEARALGVRSNCLVDVEVVFFNGRRPSDPGTADLSTSAVEVAHAMMDKVTALG